MQLRQLLIREMDTPEKTAQLVKSLAVSKDELEQYASGTKPISLSTARQICEAMGIHTIQNIDVISEIDWLTYRKDGWGVVKNDRWVEWLRTDGEKSWILYWTNYKMRNCPVMLGEGLYEESQYEEWCHSAVADADGEWISQAMEKWELIALADWEQEELRRIRSLGFVQVVNAPEVEAGVG